MIRITINNVEITTNDMASVAYIADSRESSQVAIYTADIDVVIAALLRVKAARKFHEERNRRMMERTSG